MPRSSLLVVSMSGVFVLAGCSGAIDYCGRACSPKGVHRGTNGPANAEGGPLGAPCGVGFTCDAVTSACVASDGHCATTGGTGESSTGGSGSSSEGTSASGSSGSAGGTAGETTGSTTG